MGADTKRNAALAIAVLAIKAKPPSAGASRALTAALADGVWLTMSLW
jgi:hypothetical protein